MQSTGSAYTASWLLVKLALVGIDGRGMRVMGAWGLSSEGAYFLSCTLKVSRRAAAMLPRSGVFATEGLLVGVLDSWF